MTDTKTLQEHILSELKKHKNPYQMARSIGVNPGLIHRALNGGDSPTLRRKFKIPKHPKRARLNIDTDEETIARFDNQRGELTRAEWLERLLDVGDGVGEMEI